MACVTPPARPSCPSFRAVTADASVLARSSFHGPASCRVCARSPRALRLVSDLWGWLDSNQRLARPPLRFRHGASPLHRCSASELHPLVTAPLVVRPRAGAASSSRVPSALATRLVPAKLPGPGWCSAERFDLTVSLGARGVLKNFLRRVARPPPYCLASRPVPRSSIRRSRALQPRRLFSSGVPSSAGVVTASLACLADISTIHDVREGASPTPGEFRPPSGRPPRSFRPSGAR